MLYIEKGGEAQIEDELRAYNPLVPKGHDLVATVMFEIDDARRRDAVLRTLGGIEDAMYLEIDGQKIRARSDSEVERTTEDGKTSSVHLIHFDLNADQVAKFRSGAGTPILGFDHPNYAHMAAIPANVRQALASDLD